MSAHRPDVVTVEVADMTPLKEARRRFEQRYVLAVLRHYDWSVTAAARALGLQRSNFYRKARQLRISLKPPGGES